MKLAGTGFFVAALMLNVSAASANDFSVNMFQMGDTGPDVVEKIKSNYPDARYEFRTWELPDKSQWISNGDMTIVHHQYSGDDDKKNSYEQYRFTFTGVGSGNKLFKVKREFLFNKDNSPTLDSVMKAAVEKYGPPSYQNDRSAAWKFVDQNAPAVPLDSHLGCEGSMANLSEYDLALKDFCGMYISVNLQANQIGLVSNMSMEMFNYLGMEENIEADQQYGASALEAAKKSATGAAAPKL